MEIDAGLVNGCSHGIAPINTGSALEHVIVGLCCEGGVWTVSLYLTAQVAERANGGGGGGGLDADILLDGDRSQGRLVREYDTSVPPYLVGIRDDAVGLLETHCKRTRGGT